MLIACSQKHIHTAEGSVLKTYNADDLTQAHQVSLDSAILSLCCDAAVVIGTDSGSLYTIAAERPRMLRQFKSPVSALFLKGTILGAGTECGTVCVALLRDAELVVLEEREHAAPVLGIATDGVTTYISDMQNRICTFPDRKTYDNFSTHICYCKYLFASESFFLYCKTKEAFAVCLEHTTGAEIKKFVFSRTGSVLLVVEESKVFVYDFNKRAVINEVEVGGDFVYDEDRNRLVFLRGRELATIENIADRDLLRQPMDDVFFRESKIEERIVWSEGECSDEAVQITRKKKTKSVSYEFVAKDTNTPSSNAPAAHRHGDKKDKNTHLSRVFQPEAQPARKTGLGVLFDDASSSEQQRHADSTQTTERDEHREGVCEAPSKREPFMPSSVRCGGSILMCYSTLGYLISTKDEFFSLVELRYHDNSRSSMKIKDTNFCTMGVFADGAVLLATAASLHFYSESIEWTHKSAEEVALVGISEDILGVVYGQGVLRIYKHSGLELFNCEFEAVDSICCHKQAAVVLCGNMLLRVDSATFTCERFNVIGGANWMHVGDHIYYRVASRVYVLRNGLSLRVAELENIPLCVSGGYLLALSGSARLHPEPAVEYLKMRLEHNSSCPNTLNFAVLERNDDQLAKIAEEAEEQGRHRIADDVRALMGGGRRAEQREGTGPRTAHAEEDVPVHYREKENEKWEHLEVASGAMHAETKAASFGDIKTKRYSPFKK